MFKESRKEGFATRVSCSRSLASQGRQVPARSGSKGVSVRSGSSPSDWAVVGQNHLGTINHLISLERHAAPRHDPGMTPVYVSRPIRLGT